MLPQSPIGDNGTALPLAAQHGFNSVRSRWGSLCWGRYTRLLAVPLPESAGPDTEKPVPLSALCQCCLCQRWHPSSRTTAAAPARSHAPLPPPQEGKYLLFHLLKYLL